MPSFPATRAVVSNPARVGPKTRMPWPPEYQGSQLIRNVRKRKKAIGYLRIRFTIKLSLQMMVSNQNK
jgi:hypothetical protein